MEDVMLTSARSLVGEMVVGKHTQRRSQRRLEPEYVANLPCIACIPKELLQSAPARVPLPPDPRRPLLPEAPLQAVAAVA